jgi:hypothetical protein
MMCSYHDEEDHGVAMAKVLLDAGANPNTPDSTPHKVKPLFMAAQFGRASLCTMLRKCLSPPPFRIDNAARSLVTFALSVVAPRSSKNFGSPLLHDHITPAVYRRYCVGTLDQASF